jgi:farnesyl diphosphate synthase
VDREEFARRMSVCAEQIDRVLDRLLGSESRIGELHRPARLLEAMRYAAMGGGKRLRPFLTVECARALGSSEDGVWRAAAAVELVHCYSLVHDDLPAMDDDDLRRGRPTVHKAFDEATAILTGDALLTYAFDVMAGEETHPDPLVRADLVLGLARASGIGGMAGGQALDLEAEREPAALGLEATKRLQAMKTGALLAFSVEAGAILASASPASAAAFGRYGRALGAAFQIADDILDAVGDEAAVGKRIGKDADRNKATFVAALGLDGARRACDDLVSEACAALDSAGLGARTELLALTARFVADRQS